MSGDAAGTVRQLVSSKFDLIFGCLGGQDRCGRYLQLIGLSVIAGTPSFNQRGKDIKRLLLTSASLLALLAAAPIASATTIPFSGAIVDFIVPADGTYQILAFGAQGGSSIDTQHNAVSPGGKGAEIGGDFILTKGEVLQIVVGGQGQSESASPNSGGGGGGKLCV